MSLEFITTSYCHSAQFQQNVRDLSSFPPNCWEENWTDLSHSVISLRALHKKLKSSVALLRQIAGPWWGAYAKTLQIVALSLVYSTSEYCAPVWCHNTDTYLINSFLIDTMCIVTECLCPIPMDYLPILAGIQLAELHRQGATFSLAYQFDGSYKLTQSVNGKAHDCPQRETKILTPLCACSTQVDQWIIKTEHLSCTMDWLWDMKYSEDQSKLCLFVPRSSARPLGMIRPDLLGTNQPP